MAAREAGDGAQQLRRAAAIEDRAHGDHVRPPDPEPGARLVARRRRRQVVVGPEGHVDGPLRQVGEETPELPAGEVGAHRDEARGAQGEAHQDPPAQGVGEGEVLGMGEEREVVDGGDARDPEGERARVGRREEDVEPVLPRGRGHQPLLPREAAGAAVAEGALADGGVVEQGVERGRAVEVADEPVAGLAPVPDQVAQVAPGPGGAARELTRVDPDDERPSVQGPSGRRRACGRRYRPSRSAGCARGRGGASRRRAPGPPAAARRRAPGR